MRVDLYTQARADQFQRMARDMHAESWFSGWPLDMDRLMQFVRTPGVFCALAINDQIRAVGLIVGNPADFVFSPVRVADLQLLYVDPVHRGGRAAVLLLHAFEQWARGMGLREAHLSQRTGVAVDDTARFFCSMGYRLIGSNAAKGL